MLLVGASGSIAALFGLYLVWFRHASLTFMIVVYQNELAPHWYFLIWSGINVFGMLTGQGGGDAALRKDQGFFPDKRDIGAPSTV